MSPRPNTSTLGNADRSGLHADTRLLATSANDNGVHGIFYPEYYGGDPTGIADSTAAIQAAIDAADAVNGTVHFGQATNIWKYTTPLAGASQIRLTSSGGGNGGLFAGATLLYEGTGSADAFDWVDKVRFEIDHLRFVYNQTTMTGAILDFRHAAVDPTNWYLHHCEFDYTGGGGASYARAHVMLHKCITGQIERCHFDGAKNLISMGDDAAASASYCNAVHISYCSFNDCLPNPDAGQILIASPDMNACTITNNVFSGGGSSGYVPIRGTNSGTGHDHEVFADQRSNGIASLTISGNYFGDGTAIPALIDGLNSRINSAKPILIQNNLMFSSGALSVRAGTGSDFSGSSSAPHFVYIANAASGSTDTFGALQGDAGRYSFASFGNNVSWRGTESPSVEQRVSQDFSSLPHYLKLTADSAFDDLDFTTFGDGLIVTGSRIPASGGGTSSLITASSSSYIYRKLMTGSAGDAGDRLTLQGPTDGGETGDGVQLVAGSPPTVKVRVNGTGVGFHGKTPAAQAAAYTQTFSTADRTHAARTSAALTDNTGQTPDATIENVTTPTALTDNSGGTPSDTIADVPASYTEATLANQIASMVAKINTLITNTAQIERNISDLTDQVNKNRADLADTAQVVNALVDDSQANGLCA